MIYEKIVIAIWPDATKNSNGKVFFYLKSKCYVSAFGQTYENLFLKFAFKVLNGI